MACVTLAAMVHVGVVATLFSDDLPVFWPLHNDTIHRVGSGADFYGLYHAALEVRRGASPYDLRPDGVTPYFYPFRYLPIVAEAARALLVVPPETAHRIWIAIVEGILLALVLAICRRIPGSRLRAFAAVTLLLSSPYFLELYMGQFTFAAIALCALGLLESRGVLLFAAGSVLKVVPLLAAPALVRHRRTWPHLALAALGVLLLSAPWFATHRTELAAFARLNLLTPGGLDSGNCGAVYLVWRVAGDLHLSAVLDYWPRTVVLVRLAVLGATTSVVLLSRDDRPLVGAAALLLAHFVSFAHVWEHNMSAVVVLGLLLLLEERSRPRARTVVLTSLVLLALPTPFALFDTARNPAVWDPLQGRPAWIAYAVLLPKALPTLALYGAAMAPLCAAGFGWPWSGGYGPKSISELAVGNEGDPRRAGRRSTRAGKNLTTKIDSLRRA